MDEITDIFGDRWQITRRISTAQGVDLLYGRQPGSESGSTWHLIVDPDLEAFVLAHLDSLPALKLPIGLQKVAWLRRVVSSRRYRDLADWERQRDPSEPIFWVHPDYIDLPPVQDIAGAAYTPVELRHVRPGFHIWTGIPQAETGTRPTRQIVLTPELAEYLYRAIETPANDLDTLGLPIRKEAVRRLRIRAIAHYKPDLQSFKNDPQAVRQRVRQTAQKHMLDDILYDALGDPFRISTFTEGPGGDIILRGRRLKGGHSAGNQVILTHELAAILESDQDHGSLLRLAKRLGVHETTIKRLRKRLSLRGHDPDHWWVKRMKDLLNLTPAAFTAKHGGPATATQNRRYIARYLLKCAQGKGRGPAFLEALANNPSNTEVAAKFGYKRPANISDYRTVLRLLKKSKSL